MAASEGSASTFVPSFLKLSSLSLSMLRHSQASEHPRKARGSLLLSPQEKSMAASERGVTPFPQLA